MDSEWRKIFMDDGRFYYINDNTRQTSWTIPTQTIPVAQAIPVAQVSHISPSAPPIAHAIPVNNQNKREKGLQAFKLYDTDNSNSIDQNEFYNAISYLGLGISRENINQIFNIIDTDGNKCITLNEFLDYYEANFLKNNFY